MTTTTAPELQPYDVRDPALLIAEIAERVPLVQGSAHLALVRDVSTEQEVMRVDTLRLPAEILHWEAASEELRRVVDGWPVGFERGPPGTHRYWSSSGPACVFLGPTKPSGCWRSATPTSWPVSGR